MLNFASRVPAIASAAGFNNVVFVEDFANTNGIDTTNAKTAGFNLYTSTFPFLGTALNPTTTGVYSVSNSILKITSNENPNNGGYQFSSRGYLGTGAPRTIGVPAFTAGGYFEIRMAFNPT